MPTREGDVTTTRTITLTAATLCALVLPATGHAQDATVEVVDSSFVPEVATIDVGETVTWETTGAFPHTITAEDGSFDEEVGTGDTFAHTFEDAGTFAYYCRFHGGPGGVGMSGTVVVGAAETPPPTETPTPTETTPPATGSITVSDQSGDGTTVTVDSVTITGSDGFVVVHADQDGAPGPVLGHARIEEGTRTAVAVPMNAPLTTDQTVWPMLHVDAGTAGTYEFPGPDGPVSADGQVVVDSLRYSLDGDAGVLASTGSPAWMLVVVALLATGLGALALNRRRRPA